MATKLLAIDPGICNLAWAACTVTTDPVTLDVTLTVTAYGNEDVTKACTVAGCTIRHTRELWDRMTHTDEHVIRRHAASADHVLLERQPPGGLGEVTGFFYSRYPQASFVHPRSVHKFLGIGGYDYLGRKVMSEKVARKWVPDLNCGAGRRNHDVADAVCIAVFFAHMKLPPPAKVVQKPVAPMEWMDTFKHCS